MSFFIEKIGNKLYRGRDLTVEPPHYVFIDNRTGCGRWRVRVEGREWPRRFKSKFAAFCHAEEWVGAGLPPKKRERIKA